MALKFIIYVMVVGFVRSLVLKNGAYEDLVIKISETVPENDCANIIENLQVTVFIDIFYWSVLLTYQKL